MELKIADVKIKKRIRDDIGDLKPLMESLDKYGLFHPIIVSEKFELLSGFRRLTSAKALGWEYIEAKIVHIENSVEYIERELDENLVRKDFTPDEVTKGYELLKKKQNPCFIIKIIEKIKTFLKSIKKN